MKPLYVVALLAILPAFVLGTCGNFHGRHSGECIVDDDPEKVVPIKTDIKQSNCEKIEVDGIQFDIGKEKQWTTEEHGAVISSRATVNWTGDTGFRADFDHQAVKKDDGTFIYDIKNGVSKFSKADEGFAMETTYEVHHEDGDEVKHMKFNCTLN